MATPWKHPDSGIYFFRKVIPEDVRDHLGKREFRFSLHTKNLAEAKVLFSIELAKAEAIIQNARMGGPKISQRKALALAGDWLKIALYGLITGCFKSHSKLQGVIKT